ncbi:Bug family tripartite tricarboxylate transporter substrate binding protein [Nocardiopsis oceani]
MANQTGKKPRMTGYVAGAAGLLMALTACGGGAGTDDPQHYQGQDIDLVVPYDAGGGYDSYARVMAPYLGECLDAEVVVRNEPGAGSLLATNATAADDPSALRLQVLNSIGAISAQLADAEGVEFDMREMSIIGRFSTAADAVSVSSNGGIESFEDILAAEEPVRFAATGPGSNEYITAQILGEVFDFPFEVITGFEGSGESRLSVISNDTDAHASTWDSVLPAMDAGDVVPVVLSDNERIDELPDTPAITEFDPGDEEAQALLDSLLELNSTGRSVIAPPEIPENQLNVLREAFDCAMGNEDMLDELEGQRLPVNVLGGAEFQEQVDSVMDATGEFRAALERAF